MTLNNIIQCSVYLLALTLLAIPLGRMMANVYEGKSSWLQKFLAPVERFAYRISGIDPTDDMPWTRYVFAMLLFNMVGIVFLYLLQRIQHLLPLNPSGLPAVSPEVSFNTAISFVTNTNWQTYGGETTLSYFTQMVGLTVQNFVSAATGMAIAVALIRGFTRRSVQGIGNFWVDLIRSTLYILLPLSFVLAIVLISQGVVQTFGTYITAHPLQTIHTSDGASVADQVIAVGPAASQVAIKQLGTNGGGFFNVNSAHPFENPNPFTNFLEVLAILLIPAALCFTFGEMVKDRRQGWVVFSAMMAIMIPFLGICVVAEQHGNPLLSNLGIDQIANAFQSGGNMEGKETRFGIVNSAIWATATTAASNGSVNAMHDSFTPLGGLVPMLLIQLGEIVFGGVGSGLYGMLIFAIIAVFISGLMIGRTPEYLGKKIEVFEMKMASLVLLLPAAATLFGTAIACVTPSGTEVVGNPGPHGFSEILYAFSSGANNNGSAFGGLTVNGVFYSIAIGICMFVGRYWIAIPVLAIAGSLAQKKIIPPSSGTLPTHTPLFVFILVGTILLVGALTYVPALALGPIVEHLSIRSTL